MIIYSSNRITIVWIVYLECESRVFPGPRHVFPSSGTLVVHFYTESSEETHRQAISETQQLAITSHLSPSGSTPWPLCQSQASNMCGDEKGCDTHTLKVDLSDLAGLYKGSTGRATVLSVSNAVMYWRVSFFVCGGLRKSHTRLFCSVWHNSSLFARHLTGR